MKPWGGSCSEPEHQLIHIPLLGVISLPDGQHHPCSLGQLFLCPEAWLPSLTQVPSQHPEGLKSLPSCPQERPKPPRKPLPALKSKEVGAPSTALVLGWSWGWCLESKAVQAHLQGVHFTFASCPSAQPCGVVAGAASPSPPVPPTKPPTLLSQPCTSLVLPQVSCAQCPPTPSVTSVPYPQGPHAPPPNIPFVVAAGHPPQSGPEADSSQKVIWDMSVTAAEEVWVLALWQDG